MFNLWGVGIVGAVSLFIFGAGYALVSGQRDSAALIEALRTENRLQASRLAGAYMRVERRDNAINALPTQCRDLARTYVKTGDIPFFKNPFEEQR